MAARFMAEISSAHARDLGRCLDFIDIAAEIGCYAAQFPFFRVDQTFAPEILARSEKHRERRNAELPEGFIAPIAERCERRGIALCCAPYHVRGVTALKDHVTLFKVPAHAVLFAPLLDAIARAGKPIVLATSLATLDEIQNAVATLRASGARAITIMHGVSARPTLPGEANLSAMRAIAEATGCPVGWTDHTVSPGVVHRAVHKWNAALIEFYLKPDAESPELRPGASWLPYEMATVVRDVRAAELADGTGVKAPVPCEFPDRDWRADPRDGLRPLAAIRHTWAA